MEGNCINLLLLLGCKEITIVSRPAQLGKGQVPYLILNFRRVLIVVSFILGKYPASVYYCMPTFRNSKSVPSSKAMVVGCLYYLYQ